MIAAPLNQLFLGKNTGSAIAAASNGSVTFYDSGGSSLGVSVTVYVPIANVNTNQFCSVWWDYTNSRWFGVAVPGIKVTCVIDVTWNGTTHKLQKVTQDIWCVPDSSTTTTTDVDTATTC
jgi:hypothetical protein